MSRPQKFARLFFRGTPRLPPKGSRGLSPGDGRIAISSRARGPFWLTICDSVSSPRALSLRYASSAARLHPIPYSALRRVSISRRLMFCRQPPYNTQIHAQHGHWRLDTTVDASPAPSLNFLSTVMHCEPEIGCCVTLASTPPPPRRDRKYLTCQKWPQASPWTRDPSMLRRISSIILSHHIRVIRPDKREELDGIAACCWMSNSVLT